MGKHKDVRDDRSFRPLTSPITNKHCYHRATNTWIETAKTHLSVPPNQRCWSEGLVRLHKDMERGPHGVLPVGGVLDLEGVVAGLGGVVGGLVPAAASFARR